jgi:hypothetical protein
MSLGASDYNSFVIRNACDPLRIKSLALEESLEPCRVKRHYQDIADLLSRQDRHFHIDQWLTGHDTDHEVRHMPLLGVEYTLRCLRIDCPWQSGSVGGARVQELLHAPINE